MNAIQIEDDDYEAVNDEDDGQDATPSNGSSFGSGAYASTRKQTRFQTK